MNGSKDFVSKIGSSSDRPKASDQKVSAQPLCSSEDQCSTRPEHNYLNYHQLPSISISASPFWARSRVRGAGSANQRGPRETDEECHGIVTNQTNPNPKM